MHSGVRWQCDMSPDTGVEVDAGFAFFSQPEALGNGSVAERDRNSFDGAAYFPAEKRGRFFTAARHKAGLFNGFLVDVLVSFFQNGVSAEPFANGLAQIRF